MSINEYLRKGFAVPSARFKRIGEARESLEALDARVTAELAAETRAFAEDMALDNALERFKTSFRTGLDLAEGDDMTVAVTMTPEGLVSTVVERDEVPIPDTLRAPFSFLAGEAGTGKTYLARAWCRQSPGTILAATTGIAAVNLGEGTTINALLRYFDTASLRDNFVNGRLTATLGKLFKSGVRRILLDEISMMDADQLTFLVRACEELGGRGYAADVTLVDDVRAAMEERGENPDEVLPVSITLIGDFAQLPPVKAEYAFTSPEWPKFAAHQHTLTEIRRQADRPFIEALMAARRGDATAVARFFGPRMATTVDHAFEGTTIYATNDAVSRFNALRMDTLRGKVATFTASRWAEQRGDWKNVPDTLELKEGALVMILANKREKPPSTQLIYANGDLGHVEYCDVAGRRVGVRLSRNGALVDVEFIERGNQVPIDAARRKELRGEGKDDRITEDGRFETIGTVRYLPLRVAYATTVHKSQGLSLDQVQVNTNEGMFKQPGLLYVALSRARTAEGLRLVGTTAGLKARCSVHAGVKGWI